MREHDMWFKTIFINEYTTVLTCVASEEDI